MITISVKRGVMFTKLRLTLLFAIVWIVCKSFEKLCKVLIMDTHPFGCIVVFRVKSILARIIVICVSYRSSGYLARRMAWCANAGIFRLIHGLWLVRVRILTNFTQLSRYEKVSNEVNTGVFLDILTFP